MTDNEISGNEELILCALASQKVMPDGYAPLSLAMRLIRFYYGLERI